MLPLAWQTARLDIQDATLADRDVCHSCLAESQEVADLDPTFRLGAPSEIEEQIQRSLTGEKAINRDFQMQVLRFHSTGDIVGYWHFIVVPAQPTAIGVSIMLILPNYRRQGLGRELILEACARFPVSKREIWARVYLANPRAVDFWANLGFSQLVRHQGNYVLPPVEQPSIILSRQLPGGGDA